MKNFSKPRYGDAGEDSDDGELDILTDSYEENDLIIAQPIDMPGSDEENDVSVSTLTDDTQDVDDNWEVVTASSESSCNESDSSDESVTGDDAAEGSSSERTKNAPPQRSIDDYDEEMEEDEVIKAIIGEIKKPRSRPPNIKTDDYVSDLSFHPSEDILAIGTAAGDVLVYKYTNEENVLAERHELHTKPIRAVEFSQNGDWFISTGRDRSILVTDLQTGKLKRFWEKAHEEPVYTMSVIDENLFATGDDDGMLKLWDLRQQLSIFALKEVEDFISCIKTNDQKRYLLLTSGDGYLTSINIGQRKLYVQSEPYEEELNCMGTFRKDSKLVVGSSKGNFYTFTWGQFGYHCDAFNGPSMGVNKMVPITERISIVGGEDGILRAMHMVPGRVLGVVGQHSLAVEAMDVNGTGELIASSAHDNDVRFWNVKFFEDFDDIKYNSKPDRKASKFNLPSSQHANVADFFADLADPEED